MNPTTSIFETLEKFIETDVYEQLGNQSNNWREVISKIIKEIDSVTDLINKDDSILISVKNQKSLRTCFQIITSLGILPCLLPGVGISLSRRCSVTQFLPPNNLNDEEKYYLLVKCTDFFKRSFSVPALKNIILTFHLCDYLASLIQLSFAPLKKPGVYEKFVMTQEKYTKLNFERQKYCTIYENLVSNCFQPILMKELLILQSVKDPVPPAFVKRVISRELSNQLLATDGLQNLIRCFIESYNIDSGYDWKKIQMICRIISVRHGPYSEDEYLYNICFQLKQILQLSNTYYLITAVACIISLQEKYQNSETVTNLYNDTFLSLDYGHILSESALPGTIVLTSQEIDCKVNIFHATLCTIKLNYPIELIKRNVPILFKIGMNCKTNQELKIKVRDILIKSLELCDNETIFKLTKDFLFGQITQQNLFAHELETGIIVKFINSNNEYDKDKALQFYLEIFNASTEDKFVKDVFESALKILIELSKNRTCKGNTELLELEEDNIIIDETDKNYATTLNLLSEISESSKVMSLLRDNPSSVIEFIEYTLLKAHNINEECLTISLVLLNTVLSNTKVCDTFEKKYKSLLPVLRRMSTDTSNLNSILCKEALSLISSGHSMKTETACEKAIADIFDDLLPVRAHGIIELTKLIEIKDPEVLAKKHYIFCLLQEQLKDSDSYIYLSSINGIAALGTHCTEDVLHVLCKEYLHDSNSQPKCLETEDYQNKVAEMRMKVGDVIVKVTKKLDEMAVVHKTLLLNTILCCCRDADPLIRASALSNLAEIVLVINYRVGTIIYEILLCVWSTIETDKAIECRRAAVMIISSLLKGLGKETLIQLKENLLPIYRTLKSIYNNNSEDSIMRLHAQIALEELNDIVRDFLLPEVNHEKRIFVLDSPVDFK